MNIRMLETVEDSHGYADKDGNGKVCIKYDVQKFYQGQEYDNASPDWDARAQGFIDLGKAVEV